uniref:Protein LATERAL ROOT PRIMORDIUM 1 n=1 Tax=Noccaea caerulescens TaxID=107243 RepID=A0A1J3IG84_NOCCA
MGMVGLRDVYLVAPGYHHHHQNAGVVSGSDQINSNAAAAAAAALGVGMIPLLTTAPSQQQNVEDTDINFLGNSRRWQNNNDNHNQTQYLHFKSTHQTTVGTSSNNSGSGSAASGTATCQDCGNQAKKECKQRRCRTCCKSRGFDCSTHVKSTWVSAARRRERQVMPTGNPTAGSSLSTSSGTKKARIVGSQQQATSHTSTSNTPPQSFDTSSSRQDGGGSREAWPGQVRAAAVFKCVRVTAVEDGDDEYAYQAVVKIGGHVFKGFLYDQGLEPKEGFPNMSDLHLGGGASNHNGVSTSSPILDPPNVYGGGGGSGGGFYG